MFEIDSTESAEQFVVTLRGELDTFASQQLDSLLAERVPQIEAPVVVVDLTDLGYMNSSGLRCFLRLDKLVAERGRSFVIKGTQRHVARAFIYGSLDTYFTFVDPDLSTYTHVARI